MLKANAHGLNYRPDIDGLRALAILGVLVFHGFPDLLPGGFTGVDVFFVISGFLISGLIFTALGNGSFTFQGFYARRVKRIFPALLTVLCAVLGFGWFALLANEYEQLGKHSESAAIFISNFILWDESDYFDNAAETKPLLHLWSLAIEEQFYILWPAVLYLAWRARVGFLWVALAVIAVSFTANIIISGQDQTAAFYSPLTRFWELMAGAALAYAALYKQAAMPQNAARKNIIAALGFLLIMLSFALFQGGEAFPSWRGLLPVFGAVMIIAAGPAAWMNRVLSKPLIVGIGLISYPLYLWHWPLLSFARIIESGEPAVMLRLILIAVSVLLAWLTYQFIEKPVRFGAVVRYKIPALCALMVVLGLTGFTIKKLDGLPERYATRGFQGNYDELVKLEAQDDACKNYLGQEKPAFRYCRYSDSPGTETIALIGDSHAHTAFEGIAALAASKNHDLLLLANSACPPLIGAVTGKNETERKACKKRTAALLETIISKDDIMTVIIMTRAAYYVTGFEPGGKNAGPALFSESGAPETDGRLFAASLQASVDSLKAAGKKIVIVMEWPELPLDPAACLQRPFRAKTKDCAQGLQTVLARQAQARAIVKGIRGADIIDPLPAFCPGGTCRAFEGETLLYADNDHISRAGSRFLAQEILAQALYP